MPDFTNFTREEVVAKVAAGESLEGADLEGGDLQGADLRGADLVGADLSQADLKGARYNKNTRFPEGFDPEAAGMVLEE